jgi:hypothetical protein
MDVADHTHAFHHDIFHHMRVTCLFKSPHKKRARLHTPPLFVPSSSAPSSLFPSAFLYPAPTSFLPNYAQEQTMELVEEKKNACPQTQ